MYYEIFSCVLSSIYLIIGVLIILRRNNPHLTKRTPWLVLINHFSNIAEILLILPTATTTITSESTPTITWQLRDCGILICHYLIFFTYLLRSFRILAILDLTRPDKFYSSLQRTTQKFLVKILCLMMFPAMMVSCLILAYDRLAYFFPISEPGNSEIQRQIASCIYIATSFIEQMAFLWVVYCLRHIDDKYNMTKELIIVSFLWYLSPLFSNFINIERELWLITVIMRNLLLFFVSSFIPALCTFKKSQFEEPLTLDMLNSLQIILENSKCLKYFEKFLNSTCLGLNVLEFYQKCECELIHDESLEFRSLNEYIESGNLPKEIRIEKIDNKGKLIKAKDLAYKYMTENFYQRFIKSKECEELKDIIKREEIIVSRVRRTSLIRNKYLANNKVDPRFVDRTSKTVGRLL